MKKFMAKLILVISLILLIGSLSACKDNETPENNDGSGEGTSENGGSVQGPAYNGGSITTPSVDLGDMFN